MHQEQLATLIAQYSAIGTHRTGSSGDEATSGWLIDQLGRLGLAAWAAPFEFLRAEGVDACVIAEGQRIDGTPLPDGGFTAAQGITAALRPIDQCGPGELALVMPGQSIDPHNHPLLRGSSAAAGLVLISGDPAGQVLLRNAERMADPLPVPVLQVALADAAPLVSAAERGAAITLLAEGARRLATAANVIAQRPGAGPPLVLLTPKSGWFHCAAERGSGVAIVLALAEHAIRQTQPTRPLILLFTSGHELGYAGLRAVLPLLPELNHPGTQWMHIGASLGARYPSATHLFASHPAWRDRLAAALARHGIDDIKIHAPAARPLGEGSVIADRPFVSTMGTHRYFHSTNDLPEVAVDAARALRFGLAWRELLDAVMIDSA